MASSGMCDVVCFMCSDTKNPSLAKKIPRYPRYPGYPVLEGKSGLNDIILIVIDFICRDVH